MKAKKRPVHWAILGLGNIAHKFANDLLMVENIVLEGVASRSMESAKSFAKKFGAKNYYGSYEALFNNENIEIVYIATPHSCHMENTLLALEHKVAVLCEKPFAINAAQARKMIAVSRTNKVYLMEALWSRFIPVINKVKSIIDGGTIGELKYINADFAFNAPKTINRIYDISLGGGSLLDIGIYPVFLSYLFLGIPKSIEAKANYFPSGADSQLSLIFEYENAQAVLHSSFLTHSERIAKLSGSLGELIIDAPWNESDSFRLISDGQEIVTLAPTTGRGYSHQIESCNSHLQENRIENQLWTHQHSLELIELMDWIRSIIGLEYPEDVKEN